MVSGREELVSQVSAGGILNIKVSVQKDGEVVIVGDAAGLKYLSEACQRISGKNGPAAHHHLERQMNNLVKGSAPLTVQFSSDNADFA